MQLSIRPIVSVDSDSLKRDLPFTLKDLKNAIPDYCFEPSVSRSLSYFFLD
ncbi:MAG: fatty acid desaturase, partial [Cyanobacteria bacterium J06631_12]